MSDELRRYDLAEIRKAIGVLFADVRFGAGECVEVRVFDKKKHLVVSGWFDDLEILAKRVARVARDGFGTGGYKHIHENAYWTCNPVTDALLSRQPKNMLEFVSESSSDNNITRRLWLPIDVDPLRASGVSSTNDEIKQALAVANAVLAKLNELGFPNECIVIGRSGNGYHLLIRIDLPNDKESTALLQRCLAALQGLVGTAKVEVDPKVYNAARIVKCYGTLSCKGINTPERPWRMSKLLVVPEKIDVCPKELLEKLAALAPSKNPKRDLGEKRQGPWTVQNTAEYLNWTKWQHGGQQPGNKETELAKWVGDCLSNDEHKDAAVILHNDGWWSYSCFHSSCKNEANHTAFQTHWEEEIGEKYSYPGQRAALEGTSKFELDVASDFSSVGRTEASIEPKAFNWTDVGNTERLVHRFGHLFRYCAARDWYGWDGKRWRPDDVDRIMLACIHTVRQIPEEAAIATVHLTGEDDATKKLRDDIVGGLLKWAKDSESRNRLAAMEFLGRSARGMAVRISAFDTDPWLYNCANGTIDLRSSVFRPHAQEDMITNIAPVEFDPKAECPLWLQFLDTVMAGNQEMIGFLQRAAAYSMTGSTAEHCMFLAWGTGRNGKSTFLEVLRYIMGTYGRAASMDMFLAKKQDGIPNDLAALSGARFVTGVESEENRRLAEAKIKQITGGDTVAARFLHKEFFEFVPQFKIWLATNFRPVIRGTDEGIWRRLRLIPFTVYIPDGKKDERLRDKLVSEASGILNWMLAGLEEYRIGGLMEPDDVKAATEEYRAAEDWLQRFLDSETVETEGGVCQARKLYTRYKQWAEDAKEYCLSERRFADAMQDRGLKSKLHKKEGARCYEGLVLRDHFAGIAGQCERMADPDGDL